MSIDPYGTIRAQVLDLQGNATGGAVSNNDWRLIVDNESLMFQHYDATANNNAGAYITRQSFGTGLTGISVVPLGTYSITGNLQVTDDLTVDGGTLFVDASTNRVGFGTLTPSQAVHVVGNTYVDGDLTVTGTASISSSSLWTKDGATNEITYTTANVGIGTSNPDSTLHVEGTSKFIGNMTLTGDVSLTGHIVPAADNTYDLGSASNTFRHIYVGPGSLYVNGKQVITDDSNTITISTSINQNLALKTSGTGNLQISSSGSGDIELTAGGIIQMKKTLQILDGQKITSSGGTTVVCGNNFQSEGSLRGATLTLDGSTSIGPSQINVLADATIGTGVAFKAVILDTNKDFSGIRNLTLTGDLTVSGTTTTVNSTTVAVADGMFHYAANNTSNAVDFGWYGQYVDSSVTYYSGMFRDATDNKMRFFTSTQVEPTTTVDTTGTGYAKADVVVGDIDFTSGTMRGHVIPDTTNAYDIGSAEYKIRDMYVSDNSLWVGDNHKISISNGKMKFRKRKTDSVPAVILTETAKAANGSLNADQTKTAALANTTGVSELVNMKLKDWRAYMRTLSGKATATVSEIFRDVSDDYEEETGADSWLDSGSNVYLGASGNVGIGNSTPSYKLDVTGTARITGTLDINGNMLATASTQAIDILATNNGSGSSIARMAVTCNNARESGFYLCNSTSSSFPAERWLMGRKYNSGNTFSDLAFFYTTTSGGSNGDGYSEIMRLKTNGNVGIGTTNPSEQLHLYHATDCQMRLESPGDVTLTLWADNDNNSGAGENDNPMILLSQDGGNRQLEIGLEGNTDGTIFTGSLTNHSFLNARQDGMQFGTNDSARITIDYDGNVGIGTNNPDTNLHVFNGSSGTITSNSQFVVENSTNCYLGLLSPNTNLTSIRFGDEDDEDVGMIQYNHNYDAMQFYTNAVERIRITSGGNVGIGTTTPGGKLQVNGEIITTSTNFRIGGTGAWRISVGSDMAFQLWNGGAFAQKGVLHGNTDVGQIDFTGQHRSKFSANNDTFLSEITNHIGLIVSSTGSYIGQVSIDEAIPYIELSNMANDKRVFGVISAGEDINSNTREYKQGAFGTVMDKEDGDSRIIINSVGEGGIWVCDKNGELDNGDLITSSVYGYGQLQDDDLMHGYTVGKITQNSNFNEMASGRYLKGDGSLISQTEYDTLKSNGSIAYKCKFVGCTYHCG
jgi:hypothetical protein